LSGRPARESVRDAVMLAVLALLLVTLAWMAGLVTALRTVGPSPPVPESVQPPPNWRLFGEAWGHVDREFYGPVPRGADVTYAAIEGLLATLDDPYAAFVPAAAAMDGDAGTVLPRLVTGVGAWVEPVVTGALVLATLPDSPARSAGLAPGDVLLAAGQSPLAHLTDSEMLDALDGRPGTKAVLVVRGVDGRARSVELARARPDVPEVELTRPQPGTAYLRLPHMMPEVIQAFEAALVGLGDPPSDVLVLDLRDNPGGDVPSLARLAGRLVAGPLWIAVARDGTETVVDSDPNVRPLAAAPDRLVVLVNEGTAGTAEMLASALRDRAGAELIGETTLGRRTLQAAERLADGSHLRLTVARWRAVGEADTVRDGLVPDRVVTGAAAQWRAALAAASRRAGG